MNNSKELIKQAKENQKKIEGIEKERDKLREKNRTETDKIVWKIYKPQIEKLEKEREDKVSKLDKKFEEEYNKKEQQREELYKAIGKIKRIVRFLRIQKDSKEGDININVKEDEVKSTHHYSSDEERPAEWLDYLYNDEFLKIRLAIVQNDKPKNKYSLIAFGKSIFNDESIIKWSFGYYRGDSRTLKDSSEIEELKKYLEKNKDKFLKEKIEKYKEIKKEYLEVIKTHSLTDFKEFEVFKEFRALHNEEKEKVTTYYLKSINKTKWDFNRDREAEEDFYDKNIKKYNFKILEIHNEKFY